VVTVETERGFLPSVAGWTFKGSLRSAHDEWIAGLAKVADGDRLPSRVSPAEAPRPLPELPPTGSPATQNAGHVERGVSYEGETTRLVVGSTGPPGPPRLDGPEGVTTLSLRPRSGAPELASLRWNGDWRVEAYSSLARAYVLSLHGIVGASRAVVAIRYLDESGATHESKLNDTGWYAFALVASPDGRALAFVAAREPSKGMGLELLEVATDHVVELGRPPGPPPSASSGCDQDVYAWGAGAADGYETMDPGVIDFVEGRLRVSYGADTCHARAARRTIKEWPIGTATGPSSAK
jgi:hypothetical protein